MISPARGRPTPAPMARVALISATPRGTRSRGSSSRMIAMPIGTSAIPTPCIARAAITSASSWLTAPSSDPSTITPSATTIIRFLPYMSASREIVGIATAPVSRVAVTNQAALSTVVSSSRGKSGSSGSTRVCCSDTVVPHSARVAMTRALRVAAGVASGAVSRAGAVLEAELWSGTVLLAAKGCSSQSSRRRRSQSGEDRLSAGSPDRSRRCVPPAEPSGSACRSAGTGRPGGGGPAAAAAACRGSAAS